MVYCVAKAEFFFGFELPKDKDEHGFEFSKYDDYDELEKLEELVEANPAFKFVHTMMGCETSRYFIAAKKSYHCSDDMELVDLGGSLGELDCDTIVYALNLISFIKKNLPEMKYKNEDFGWKLISGAWSST